MPLADKMSGWFGRIEENENGDKELQIEEQSDDALENAPALQSHKDFISKTPAYQWFVANLQWELCLEPSTITNGETVPMQLGGGSALYHQSVLFLGLDLKRHAFSRSKLTGTP